MLRIPIFLALFLGAGPVPVPGQLRGLPVAQQGMAEAGMARPGILGLAHNPAAAAAAVEPEAVVMVEDRFSMGAIRQVALAVAGGGPRSGIAIGLSGLGNAVYREHRLAFSYARRLADGLSLGLMAGLSLLRITGYRQDLAPEVAVGFHWQASEKVRLGGSLHNPVRVYRTEWDRMPTRLGLGVAFAPYPPLLLLAEMVKDLDLPPWVRLGLAYRLGERFILRCGVRPDPVLIAFGLGVDLTQRLRLDLSARALQRLPLTPALGLHWRAGRRPASGPDSLP